jgi:hypothetical protein
VLPDPAARSLLTIAAKTPEVALKALAAWIDWIAASLQFTGNAKVEFVAPPLPTFNTTDPNV